MFPHSIYASLFDARPCHKHDKHVTCEDHCPAAHCALPRYGQGRTRKRTPGQGSTQRQKGQKGGGSSGSDSWTMAMSAMQDLASVARSVVEGKGTDDEKKKG